MGPAPDDPGRVLSGFQLSPVISYNSSRPFNLYSGTDTNGDRTSFADRPPGVGRNSLNLPGYRGLDLTLAKAFGLPNARVLGENAKIELRMDAYNVFNNLNFNPNQISNNVGSSNFGTITGALSARVLSLGARFSF